MHEIRNLRYLNKNHWNFFWYHVVIVQCVAGIINLLFIIFMAFREVGLKNNHFLLVKSITYVQVQCLLPVHRACDYIPVCWYKFHVLNAELVITSHVYSLYAELTITSICNDTVFTSFLQSFWLHPCQAVYWCNICFLYVELVITFLFLCIDKVLNPYM